MTLDETFEKYVVALVSSSRAFWEVAKYLDEEDFNETLSVAVFRVVQEISKDTKQGVSSPALVVQRFLVLREEGDVRFRDIDPGAFRAFLVTCLAVFEASQATEESVTVELAKIVQERVKLKSIDKLIEAYSNRNQKAYEKALRDLELADSIGVATRDTGVSTEASDDLFDDIDQLDVVDWCRTGIPVLDAEVNGAPRGALCLVMGETGHGKSIFLNHVTAAAAHQGKFCVYITLEVRRALAKARLLSALADVPTRDIQLKNEQVRQRVKRVLKRVGEKGGVVYIQQFDPRITTVAVLDQFLDRLEDMRERKVEFLAVDYGDLLGAVGSTDESADFHMLAKVYTQLDTLARHRGIWLWTASQTRNRKREGKNKILHNRDIAGSIEKIRLAFLAVSIDKIEGDPFEGEEGPKVRLFVTKNRDGKDEVLLGEVERRYEHGLVCPPSPEIWELAREVQAVRLPNGEVVEFEL